MQKYWCYQVKYAKIEIYKSTNTKLSNFHLGFQA